MPKVLIADKLPDSTVNILAEAGLEIVNKPGLKPDDLKQAIRDVDGVIVRSGVQLTADILEAADRLRAICRAGVGVDNIDLAAATRKGIVVMNTPGANTISTAEHTFALILALSRNVGPAYISMREGKWDRKRFVGAELAGTTLGIVGLGRIGQAVAARALAFGMKVVGHDPFIARDVAANLGVRLLDSLEEVLKVSDYVTVHVPGSEQTRGLIGEREIALMKPGARLINCARGEVLDQAAVTRAVEAGRLAGAALDVYEEEPPPSFEFARNDRILATPHLGASTEAAQLAVGTQAAEQMVEALIRGEYPNALNIVSVSAEEMERLRPYCELAQQLGKSAGCLNRGRPRAVRVTCFGEVAEHNTAPIVNYGVMGVLQSMVGNNVNIVSAPQLAEERGMQVTSSTSRTQQAGFTDLIALGLSTDAGEIEIAGTVLERKHPRIVRIGQFQTEVVPEGHLLMVFAKDRPGLIGKVGEVLGRTSINIARMTFSRKEAGGEALLALNLDSPCGEEALKRIRALDLVEKAIPLPL